MDKMTWKECYRLPFESEWGVTRKMEYLDAVVIKKRKGCSAFGAVDITISESLKEGKPQYCPKCMEYGYHSCLHQLRGENRCFLHRQQELIPVSENARPWEQYSVYQKLQVKAIDLMKNKRFAEELRERLQLDFDKIRVVELHPLGTRGKRLNIMEFLLDHINSDKCCLLYEASTKKVYDEYLRTVNQLVYGYLPLHLKSLGQGLPEKVYYKKWCRAQSQDKRQLLYLRMKLLQDILYRTVDVQECCDIKAEIVGGNLERRKYSAEDYAKIIVIDLLKENSDAILQDNIIQRHPPKHLTMTKTQSAHERMINIALNDMIVKDVWDRRAQIIAETLHQHREISRALNIQYVIVESDQNVQIYELN